jgi:hypothetical protein
MSQLENTNLRLWDTTGLWVSFVALKVKHHRLKPGGVLKNLRQLKTFC